MIGTKVKVGYDGAAVSRGVKKTERELRGLSKSIPRGGGGGGILGGGGGGGGFGSGGLIGMLVQGVSALGRGGGWSPTAIKEMIDFVGATNDVATATRSTAKDIVVLQEALRLAGAESVNTARMILNMRDAINQAASGDETMMQNFEAIGLSQDAVDRLRTKPAIEQFREIGNAISATMGQGPGSASARGMPMVRENIGEIVGDIFGSRMTAKLLPALTDMEGTMAQAESNTAEFNKKLGDSANDLDNLGDALGRREMMQRTNALGFIQNEAFGGVGGFTEKMNKFYDDPTSIFKDALDSSGIMQGISDSLNVIKDGIESIKSLKTIFQ